MTASEALSIAFRLEGLSWRNPDTGCIEWQGPRSNGYGRMSIHGKTIATHRLAYAIRHGEVPAGLWVCHHCDNPPCMNPEHLFAGTRQDNVDDRERKGRNIPPPIHRYEDHHKAKLNWEIVGQIRQELLTMTQAAISRKRGIPPKTISDIVVGKTWRPKPPEAR